MKPTHKSLLSAAAVTVALGAGAAQAAESAFPVRHQFADVNGVKVFYREAGPQDGPAVLLLHGFGASSHMFRELMPQLAAKYRVIAPDLPGFGMTTVGEGVAFRYTFDKLADVIEAFAEARGLQRYAMYVFDYGAPVGWRLAVRHPGRITALVTQNGNAYEEGLSDGWADMRKAWRDPSPANREALRKFNSYDMVKWPYFEGVRDPSLVAPEAYVLAHEAIVRHGADLQVDLLADYGSNVRQYPQVQAYFRRYQPPTLAIWGKNDPFSLPAGAHAFVRDNPNAEVQMLDTGHFAIETHGKQIAASMLAFLDRHVGRQGAAAQGKAQP